MIHYGKGKLSAYKDLKEHSDFLGLLPIHLIPQSWISPYIPFSSPVRAISLFDTPTVSLA